MSGVFVENLSVVERMIEVTVTLYLVSTWLRAIGRRRNGNHSQSTEGKDEHQGALLVDGQLARPNRLHGQQENQDIGSDGEAGVGVPIDGQIDAGGLD